MVSFWGFVAIFVLGNCLVLALLYAAFPGAQRSIKERALVGMMTTFIIIIGLWVILSGVFYQPKDAVEDIVLSLLGTLMLSATGGAIAFVIYEKKLK